MEALLGACHADVEQPVDVIGVALVLARELRGEVREQQHVIGLAALGSVDRGQLDGDLAGEFHAPPKERDDVVALVLCDLLEHLMPDTIGQEAMFAAQ